MMKHKHFFLQITIPNFFEKEVSEFNENNPKEEQGKSTEVNEPSPSNESNYSLSDSNIDVSIYIIH